MYEQYPNNELQSTNDDFEIDIYSNEVYCFERKLLIISYI